jgi:acetoin utilization deacetylase AcuC-like enzyme
MKPTGILTDHRFHFHDPGEHSPENPGRMAELPSTLLSFAGLLVFLEVNPADQAQLERIHSPAYVRQIAATAGREYTALNGDTGASAESYLAARLAVGACQSATEAVMSGRLANAFALIRPPGHHAEFSRAMGYCLFNNVALAAAFALDHFNIRRILIVDWDVHHGNGTQHLFEADPRILFFSVHQSPLYPGTGSFTEVGRGPGEGYTINVPMPKGLGDAEYAAVFQHLLVPVAEAFFPELILVSAGFDSHRLDPLGAMKMSSTGFAALTRCLMMLADRLCYGRLALVLEGGYHPASLAKCVGAVLAELSGVTISAVDSLSAQADFKRLNPVLTRCRQVHQSFWSCLRQSRPQISQLPSAPEYGGIL